MTKRLITLCIALSAGCLNAACTSTSKLIPPAELPAAFTGTAVIHPAFGWTLAAPEAITLTFEYGSVYENPPGAGFHVRPFEGVRWEQMLDDLQRREAEDPSDAQIILRETTPDYDMFAFHSSGKCAYRKILIHIGEQMLESAGMCDGTSDAKWERHLRLARSMKKPEPVPAITVTAFDECGPISRYKNADWFDEFEKAASAIAFDPNASPSFGEGCVALNGSLFIVTWIGENCLGNRLLRYDISHRRLAVAMPNLPYNDPSCHMRIEGFGKRNGNSIPVHSVIDTDNCDSTINGTYDIARNYLNWGTAKVTCEKEYY